jgi:hypothetical protein
MIVDFAIDYFAKFYAHFFEKFVVYVVVEIDKGAFFGGYRAHPVLIGLKFGQWQIERLQAVVASFFDRGAEETRVLERSVKRILEHRRHQAERRR